MEDKKEIKPLELKGSAKVQKQSLGKKMHDAFISQDFKSAASGVVQDTFVPMTKRLMADLFSNLVNRILFGSNAPKAGSSIFGSGSSWRYSGQNINYSSFSQPSTASSTPSIPNYNEITLSDRGDAERVLDTLQEMLDRYGSVSIADLYETVGIPTISTHYNYGWKSLKGADVESFRGEFLVKLPRPIPLK